MVSDQLTGPETFKISVSQLSLISLSIRFQCLCPTDSKRQILLPWLNCCQIAIDPGLGNTDLDLFMPLSTSRIVDLTNSGSVPIREIQAW